MARPKRRKDTTALDVKLQALHEQQEKLHLQMEEHRRLIEEAPRLAKQQESDRRKELMTRDARVFTKFKATTIADPRAGFHASPRSKPLRRRTRRERQEARAMFFCLLVLVAVLVGWLMKVLM